MSIMDLVEVSFQLIASLALFVVKDHLLSRWLPFGSETGNFKEAFHADKKKPNSSKKLNFNTLNCANCGGFVMVFEYLYKLPKRIDEYRARRERGE